MKRILVIFLLAYSAFAQTNNARMLSGVNSQTGPTYLFAPQDVTRLTTFSNASAVAATLPNTATAGFGAGSVFSVQNVGAGTVTISTTVSLFFLNGAGSSSISLTTGQGADIYSSGTNFYIQAGIGGNGSLPNPANFPGLVNACTINAVPQVGPSLCNATWGGGGLDTQLPAAYASLPSGGGSIHLTAGTYTVANPINLYAGVLGSKPVNIICDSGANGTHSVTGSTIINSTITSGAAVNFSTGSPGGGIYGCTIVGANQTNGTVGLFLSQSPSSSVIQNTFSQNNISGFGACLEFGANTYIDLFINNWFHDCGTGGGQHVVYAPSGQAGFGENITFLGGELTNTPLSSAFATNCVDLENSGTVKFIAVSFDQCGITINTPNGIFDFSTSHVENSVWPTASDFLTIGPLCSNCTVNIAGENWNEDGASARTEFIGENSAVANNSVSIKIEGVGFTAAEPNVAIATATGATCCQRIAVRDIQPTNIVAQFPGPFNGPWDGVIFDYVGGINLSQGLSWASENDVLSFAGTDLCQQISNAIAYSFASGGTFVIDARGVKGNQYCTAAHATTMFWGGQTVYTASPVTFMQGNFAFVIDGPTNGTNYTDGSSGPGGPSGVGTPMILIPSQTHWSGENYNTALVTFCTGSGTPLPACGHAFPQRSLATIDHISMAGTTATLVPSSGTLTAIACSPTCSGNIMVGERFQIVGAPNQTSNITGVVQSVTNGSPGSFTFNAEAGTATCAATCGGTVYLGTPVIGLASGCGTPCTQPPTYLPGSQVGAGIQGFNQVLEHLSLSEQGNQADASLFTGYGVIGLQNDNGGDQGYANDLEFHYNTFIAFDLGPGSTDYHYRDLRTTGFSDIHIIPSTISMFHAATDRGVDGFGFIEGPISGLVNTQNAGTGGCAANCVSYFSGTHFLPSWTSGTPFTINGVSYTISSVQNTSLLTLTTAPGTQTQVLYQANQAWTSIELDGIRNAFIGTTTLRDGHTEATFDNIWIASNNACRGCKITGFLGSPTGAHSTNDAVFRIMAAGGNCQGCKIDGVRQSGIGLYTMRDDTNLVGGVPQTCTDVSLGQYDTDQSGGAITNCVAGTLGNGTILNSSGVITNGTVNVTDGNFGSQITYNFKYCESSGAATSVNTGGTTTTTGVSCLPAGSVIDAVVYRITTTITTAANFTVGDGTTATRFCTTQSTLTAGTTGICGNQWFSATAGTFGQAAAHALVTTFNANPGAGAIRFIVYYHTWTAPTS